MHPCTKSRHQANQIRLISRRQFQNGNAVGDGICLKPSPIGCLEGKGGNCEKKTYVWAPGLGRGVHDAVGERPKHGGHHGAEGLDTDVRQQQRCCPPKLPPPPASVQPWRSHNVGGGLPRHGAEASSRHPQGGNDSHRGPKEGAFLASQPFT